jgi:hypothetical protein
VSLAQHWAGIVKTVGLPRLHQLKMVCDVTNHGNPTVLTVTKHVLHCRAKTT